MVEINITDIHDDVIYSIGERLRHYCIPILTLDENKSPPKLKPSGSGTLARVGDRHYVLTAAHVWDEVKKSEQIYFQITERWAAFSIKRDHVSAQCIPDIKPQKWGEWGPDLALLELPLADVSEIRARKSFLDLQEQRCESQKHPSQIEKTSWAVMGMVGECSSVERRSEEHAVITNVHMNAYFGGVQKRHDRNSFDYLDVSAKLSLNDVPESFGGISGGGLWQVALTQSGDGDFEWDGARHFRGVAFWQSPAENDRRVIRCHGPTSIYETAWKTWDLG